MSYPFWFLKITLCRLKRHKITPFVCIYRHFSLWFSIGQEQREWGDNGLFITLVPKVLYIVFYFVCLITLGTFVNLIGWFIKLSVHTFQSPILIYGMGNSLYHEWGCTSIYRLLSYPLRSLVVLLWINPFLFSKSYHNKFSCSQGEMEKKLLMNYIYIPFFLYYLQATKGRFIQIRIGERLNYRLLFHPCNFGCSNKFW